MSSIFALFSIGLIALMIFIAIQTVRWYRSEQVANDRARNRRLASIIVTSGGVSAIDALHDAGGGGGE